MISKLGCGDKDVIKSSMIEAAEMNNFSFKYAWVLDKLKAERERGITIDISLHTIETRRYYCTFIDTPGHRDFIKNMINGTCQADCALLIIDSTTGGFETGFSWHGQTREHALLAFTLGVNQMICCFNKMDATTPKYSRYRFLDIVSQVLVFLRNLGYDPFKDLKRGDVASNLNDDPANEAVYFKAHVIIMCNYPGQIVNGYKALLDCHTSHTAVKFAKIFAKVDSCGYVIEDEPKFLKSGDAGIIKMIPTKPIVVEPFHMYPPLARFTVRDMNQIVAVGVVKSVIRKSCVAEYGLCIEKGEV